jgi:hypothetical protein
MKTLYRFVAAAILFLPIACCSPTLAQSPDSDRVMNRLDPFIGTWNKEWTVHQSEWTPKEEKATGTHTWEWILEKQHMQETGKDSTGSKYISIWSYDNESRSFRVATFQSSGNSQVMNGEWDSKSRTFTATNDLGNGVEMTATYVLKNKDLFEFSYVAKDSSGKIYFNLQGIGKRAPSLK